MSCLRGSIIFQSPWAGRPACSATSLVVWLAAHQEDVTPCCASCRRRRRSARPSLRRPGRPARSSRACAGTGGTGAWLRILDRVEERLVVVRPGDRADPLRVIRQSLPGAQILHRQRVLAEAGVIGGVGEQVAVVADVEAAERHELLPFASSFTSSRLLPARRRCLSCGSGSGTACPPRCACSRSSRLPCREPRRRSL